MSVDPGTEGIGISIFNGTQIKDVASIEKNETDWEIRLNKSLATFKIYLNTWNIGYAVIERPKYFDSYVGQTAASTDALFKLIFAYGRIVEALNTRIPYMWIFQIPVIQWKGQLSKKQVQSRLQKYNPRYTYKSHDADALALGLWALGEIL